jgi:hypothetical protein
VPLNTEAVEVLCMWGRRDDDCLVFPGDEEQPMVTLKTAWVRAAAVAKRSMRRTGSTARTD